MFYSASSVAITALVTFDLAFTATPGADMRGGDYPYLYTLKLFPKDYLWMFLAIPLLLAYVM